MPEVRAFTHLKMNDIMQTFGDDSPSTYIHTYIYINIDIGIDIDINIDIGRNR
jgi:hypothetical protein